MEPWGGLVQWFRWPGEAHCQGDPADALRLKGVPASAPDLRARSVVVIGLGAVGGVAFGELARAGVGTLIGIDLDDYGAESRLTQPIRRFVDTGRAKADVQGARAHAINPAVNVITVKGLAQNVPLWVFRQADLILAAIDNLEVLVWAGNLAAALKKPLLQGAVHGESWLAIVRSFDLTDENLACPACGLSEREWTTLRSRIGCDPSTLREQGVEPTRTLSSVCGTAAHLLVGESLKWLFEIDRQKLASEELCYCLLSHKSWRTRLNRNAQCRCPHKHWEMVDVDGSPESVTLAMLAGRAQGDATLIQGELPWISFTICPKCERRPNPVRRFGRAGESLGHCVCGEPLVASPIGVRSMIPSEDVRCSRDLALSKLGLPSGSAVGISTNDHWTYYFVGKPRLPITSAPPLSREE